MRKILVTGRQKMNKMADALSVCLVCLLPVVTGAILFRLVLMTGVPVWFYVLQGVFFISSLIQLIYFLSAGRVRAVRRKPDSSDAKCRPDSRDTRLRPDSGDSNRKPDKAEGR